MKRKRVSYIADFKLNAVEKANEVGNREAARFFNVDESNIRLWRRNKTNFENCDRRKRADRRGKPHWPELEAQINKWILKERDDGKARHYCLFYLSNELACLFDQLTPNLSVPTDGVVSWVFIESIAQEQVVDLHSGMAADWACFVSSRLNSGGLLPKSPVH
ncbi:uncharacterized protein TNCV_138211 [Trichonephila clavipes]|nr:uncharacterized protein TNCV_138211 [Trichonephila clavipes]